MPCQTDPIPPDRLAIEAFRLKKLVAEIKTGKKPNQKHWDAEGVINTKYMKHRTVFLCKTLRATPPAKIKKYSLELQLWVTIWQSLLMKLFSNSIEAAMKKSVKGLSWARHNNILCLAHEGKLLRNKDETTIPCKAVAATSLIEFDPKTGIVVKIENPMEKT